MSRFAITIGNKIFSSKNAALKFYKEILNKYDYGEIISNDDVKYLMVLSFKEEGRPEDINKLSEEIVADFSKKNNEKDWNFHGVMVDRHLDFRTTKCFYFFGEDKEGKFKDVFSYRLAINGQPSDMQIFSRACRFTVYERIRKFKIKQFKNRPVKCAVSNEIVEWEECQIDHKSPLTFSVIVKSFIVANDLDISKIDYTYNNSRESFTDVTITEKFYEFHRKMAVLRIASTKENLKLSGSARIKPTKKDGVLED